MFGILFGTKTAILFAFFSFFGLFEVRCVPRRSETRQTARKRRITREKGREEERIKLAESRPVSRLSLAAYNTRCFSRFLSSPRWMLRTFALFCRKKDATKLNVRHKGRSVKKRGRKLIKIKIEDLRLALELELNILFLLHVFIS